MPDDARERPAPRSFRESFRALAREFSGPVLAAVGVGALVLLVWGVRDVQQARWAYLNVAGFHGYLELAVAARWLMREGR